MHLLRALYPKRQFHKLHALILIGVSTIAELVLSSASPLNVVDELRIPYFTFAEVQHLIAQHSNETGQPFEQPVIQAIYANTAGQPGLVCALCQYLVTEQVPDHNRPVTMNAFYTKIFTTHTRFEQGKQQLADYLASEGVAEGHYVVFSNKHGKGDTLELDEMIDGKRVYPSIIRTQFDLPNRRSAKKRARL